MSVDQITAYAVELRIYRDQASVDTLGKYLEIPLPEEVASFEGANIGEKSFYAHLEIEDNLSYLRITPENDSSRHYLKLKKKSVSSPSLAVSLPAEYAINNDQSPFKGLGHGDRVNIEIREEDHEVRVFTPDDFPRRVNQLSEEGTLTDFDTPIIAPFLASGNGYTDLTTSDNAASQKFEIIPFNGQHKSFVEVRKGVPAFRSRSSNRREVFRGGPHIFRAVRDEYGIPIVEADIRVEWAPEADPSIVIYDETNSIYSEESTSSAKVELKEEGSYLLLAEKDGDGGVMWLAPDPRLAMTDPIRDSWSSFIYEDDEDWEAPKIYIPMYLGEQRGYWPDY